MLVISFFHNLHLRPIDLLVSDVTSPPVSDTHHGDVLFYVLNSRLLRSIAD